MTSPTMPGVFSFLKQSLSIYKKNWKTMVFTGLIPFLLLVGANLFSNSLHSYLTNLEVSSTLIIVVSGFFSLVTGLFFWFFMIVVQIAYIRLVGKIHSGETVSINEIYKESFKLGFPSIWISILAGLIGIGSGVFFLIPALILGGFLIFSNYCLAIDNFRGINALSASFYYVKNNWWRVFWRFLGFAIILLLVCVVLVAPFVALFLSKGKSLLELSASLQYSSGAILVILSVLSIVGQFLYSCVFIPLQTEYSFLIYNNLKSIKEKPNSEVAFVKTKQWFIGLSIWGILAIGLLILIQIVFAVWVASRVASTQQQGNTSQTSVSNQMQSLFPKNPTENIQADTSLLQSKVYSNKKFRLSFNPPKDWKVSADADAIIVTPPTFKTEASFVIEPVKITLEAYKLPEELMIERVADDVIHIGPTPEHVSFQKKTIGSNVVYIISGEFPPDNNINYTTTKIEYYLIPDGLQVFVIAVRSSEESWKTVRALMYSSLATLNISKE